MHSDMHSNDQLMRALHITEPGALRVEAAARPRAGAREILVRVRAAGLNRADLMQLAGRYPAPEGSPRDIPGLEFAGTVEAIGDGASRWRSGDRVCGLVGGGGQAEYLTTHEDAVLAIPDSMDFVQAAAVPEAFITAHDALVTQAAMREGERVMIFAVASGVGLAAVHLIRALGGRAFGTTRTPDKLDRVRAEGLTDGAAIDTPNDVPAHAEAWSGGAGMDIVLDLVGGGWSAAAVQTLAPHGRLMCIGTLAGSSATLDLRRMLSRRLTARGTMLRGRTLVEKIGATAAFERDVGPLLASGAVRPVIDGVYPLEDARAAYDRLADGATVGKLVLTMDA
jgi:putative PIG3 family NAD(P)H quinone oxidoreductase